MQKEEVSKIITDAFSDTLLASLSVIFIPSADWYFDASEAAADFLGRKWDEVTIEALERNRHRIWAMTPEAFHYYFPNFLLAVINHPKEADVLHEHLLSTLIPPDPRETSYGRWIEQADKFTQEQIEAILTFLESYTDLFPPEQRVIREKDRMEINIGIGFWEQKVK